jgi:hypothetical protein
MISSLVYEFMSVWFVVGSFSDIFPIKNSLIQGDDRRCFSNLLKSTALGGFRYSRWLEINFYTSYACLC